MVRPSALEFDRCKAVPFATFLQRLALVLCGWFGVVSVQSAEVRQVTWATSHAAAPAVLAAPASEYLPAFRLGIQALPEASIVALTLSQPAFLGLTAEQAGRLQPLAAERYRLLTQSEVFAAAASALPYCYSERKPERGLASVYVPDGAGPATPAILFLHGYGGSFLWYQHYLSEIFPDHLIVCPAYGITTASIPPAYVTECLTAVSQQLGLPITKPCLIGLSAGGYGACGVYVSSPRTFSQLICLAASPPEETAYRFPSDARPRFLAGGIEPFVLSGDFQRQTGKIQRACPETKAATIPGADHFFLLTHRDAATAYLRSWIPAKPPAAR